MAAFCSFLVALDKLTNLYLRVGVDPQDPATAI
jgi:hypothetical protein